MKKIIYVYGVKGGVGKTSISINIAAKLANMNKSVVLVDMDISGPNIHKMLNSPQTKSMNLKNLKIVPAEYENIKLVSTGLIFDNNEISFFSGKYLEGLLNQLVINNEWDCEYIIIDMPPGFDEIHKLTFGNYPGKIILVTTPHSTSYDNLQRGITHLKKLNLEITGIIENISHVTCPKCHFKTDFSNEKSIEEYEKIKIPFSLEFMTSPPKEVNNYFFTNEDIKEHFEKIMNRWVV